MLKDQRFVDIACGVKVWNESTRRLNQFGSSSSCVYDSG